MTSWIVTPCEVLLTNSISLWVFAVLLVEARVLCGLKGVGAASAIPKERVSEFGIGKGTVYKQRKSAINNSGNRLNAGTRSVEGRICIFKLLGFYSDGSYSPIGFLMHFFRIGSDYSKAGLPRF